MLTAVAAEVISDFMYASSFAAAYYVIVINGTSLALISQKS
jgi:hypothetical protein